MCAFLWPKFNTKLELVSYDLIVCSIMICLSSVNLKNELKIKCWAHSKCINSLSGLD